MWLLIVVGALAMASFGSLATDKDFVQDQVLRNPAGLAGPVPLQTGN